MGVKSSRHLDPERRADRPAPVAMVHVTRRAADAGMRLGMVLALLLTLVVFARPARAAAPLAVPVATNARVNEAGGATRFEADLTFAIPFNVFVKAHPYRVFIDLPAVDFRFGNKAGKTGRGVIRAFRYGRMGEKRARIVLDVAGPVLIRRSWVRHARDGRPARMGVELVPTDEKTFASLLAGMGRNREPARKTAGGRKKRRADADVTREADRVAAAYRRLIEQALKDAATGEPRRDIGDLLREAPLALDEAAPGNGEGSRGVSSAARSKGGGASEDRKKEGKAKSSPAPAHVLKPLVVIDPGHGGKDPGAIGWKETKEKDLVLAFARDLARSLKRRAGVRVAFTRMGDTFLTLRQRVEFARKRHAKLFISIHADKFRSGAARGLAVYTLSEEASDEEAAELARSENAADVVDGVDLGAEAETVRNILVDLAMRETKNSSVHFARALTRSLRGKVRLRARPIRSADFRVLRNPDVPAVLVELGYVSNPTDVRNMKSRAWRRKATEAMARAVRDYLKMRVALER